MEAYVGLYHAIRALNMAPNSFDIHLFGSAARKLRETQGVKVVGDDLDLIVTVDPALYRCWVTKVRQLCTAKDNYDGFMDERLEIALNLLGIGSSRKLTTHYGWLTTLHESLPLDIILMPLHWREQLDEIQLDLPYHDPRFIRNINRDAIFMPPTPLHEFLPWFEEVWRHVVALVQGTHQIRKRSDSLV